MGYPAAPAVMNIDAEIRVPIAKAQLVRFDMAGPADNILRDDDAYWLDLCLTPRPRNARGCFVDHWNPHRFERIGKVFLVPPREAMHAKSDGHSTQASLLCHLNPGALQQWLDTDLQWTDRRLEANLNIADANIQNLLLRLAAELREPGFAAETMVELIGAQLAIELRRYCGAVSEMPGSGGLAGWRLRLIDERLREVREAPNLSELAALCRLSVRQLTRGFRTSRGCSIGDYVADSRLEHAKRLLEDDLSVKAVAYSLGFASPSSFCFAFRRATTETPRQYRQRMLRSAYRV
jgi:AraC family transcriptional regulator